MRYLYTYEQGQYHAIIICSCWSMMWKCNQNWRSKLIFEALFNYELHKFLLPWEPRVKKVLQSMTCKTAYLPTASLIFNFYFAGLLLKKWIIQIQILHKNLQEGSNFFNPIITVQVNKFHLLKMVQWVLEQIRLQRLKLHRMESWKIPMTGMPWTEWDKGKNPKLSLIWTNQAFIDISGWLWPLLHLLQW